jgi:2-(1,2-epoxy-1,2-dihydrophenyl)acetyl-CoA isomerase
MGYPLSLSTVDGIAHLELTRAHQSNSVDLDTARAFDDAMRTIELDDGARVVLLTGEGRRFCAGGDVGSMAAAGDRGAYLQELADVFDGALQRLDALAKPVVVAVQGAVAGAGIGLMLAGDLVVAERSTKFVTAYGGVGLTRRWSVARPSAGAQVRADQRR